MDFAAAVALAFVVAIGDAAAQPSPPDVSFRETARTFQRALAGEQSAVAPVVTGFEALAHAEPHNSVYAAYLGSAYCLKGRDAWMPWNKLKYTEQGLDLIDQALQMLRPENDQQTLRGTAMSIETRAVAATTFLSVPERIFHRRTAGKRLTAELLADPALATAPPPLRAAVHLAAANAARDEQPAEEIAQLEQALALASSGDSAERARARLKELGR